MSFRSPRVHRPNRARLEFVEPQEPDSRLGMYLSLAAFAIVGAAVAFVALVLGGR